MARAKLEDFNFFVLLFCKISRDTQLQESFLCDSPKLYFDLKPDFIEMPLQRN